MFEFIENLRKKPKAVRHQIAAGSALTLTLIIFVGWLAGFTYTSPLEDEEEKSSGLTETINAGPIEKMGQSFSDFFVNATDNISVFNSEPDQIKQDTQEDEEDLNDHEEELNSDNQI